MSCKFLGFLLIFFLLLEFFLKISLFLVCEDGFQLIPATSAGFISGNDTVYGFQRLRTCVPLQVGKSF